jgi:hypothetical protein
MLAISLGGQQHMFGPDGIHGELSVMLRPILQGMLGYMGLLVLTPFVAYHVPYLSQEIRQQILRGLSRTPEQPRPVPGASVSVPGRFRREAQPDEKGLKGLAHWDLTAYRFQSMAATWTALCTAFSGSKPFVLR